MSDRTYKKIMLMLGTASALSVTGHFILAVKNALPKKPIVINSNGSIKELIQYLDKMQQSHSKETDTVHPE